MAGLVSSPLAYANEKAFIGPAAEQIFGRHELPVIEGQAIEVSPGGGSALAGGGPISTAQPEEKREPRRPVSQPGVPVLRPRIGPQAAASDPGAAQGGRQAREIQRLLMQAGIDVGPEGDDGRIGPNTRAAMEAFARITQMPGELEPGRVLARLRAYPPEQLAADLAAELGQR
jgi:hypothetical protein